MQTVLVDTERNAQGAQLQNASACTFFFSYKMKNITLSGSENNSKPVLQNPMHLKLKK